MEEGGFINAFACYNPADDTYLVNWEDFRNVSNWMENTDIYGALIDGDGNIVINDIPMVDDYGMDNEGDQRVQSIVYNPDRNEFLAMWWDSRPSLDGGGVVGRIIKSDGTPLGPDFVIADAPGSQSFPHGEYVDSRQMYFVLWDDTKNSDTAADDEEDDRDIYAKWLSPSGESGGDILCAVYGAPSFHSCRVVEKDTKIPVENAMAFVMGLGLPSFETTNSGGWFNIASDGRSSGRYFIFVRKNGYSIAVEPVSYTGEPLNVTIEIEKKQR